MRLALLAKLRSTHLKWTPVRVAIAVAACWLGLMALSAEGRICTPILSPPCQAHAWNFIGDLVWLKSLKQWETLATGILALAAALIGGGFLVLQMRQTERLEKDRLRRAMASARSELARGLSQLTDYLEGVAATLRDLHNACRGGVLPPDHVIAEFDYAPLEAEAVVTRMVEVSDEDVGLLFSQARSMLQVLRDRLNMLSDAQRPSGRSLTVIEERIVDAIEIHAHCLGLFPLARPETKEMPTRAVCSNLISSMRACGFDHAEFPDLNTKVVRRMQRKLQDAADSQAK